MVRAQNEDSCRFGANKIMSLRKIKHPYALSVAAIAAVAAVASAVASWVKRGHTVVVVHPNYSEAHAAGTSETQATGLLAAAVQNGTYEAPTYVPVTLPDPAGDLTMMVGADMLRVTAPDGTLIRGPVSWPDTIAIANTLGGIAPSKRIADAIYAAAPIKTVFHSLVTASDPESGGAKMHGLPFAERYNTDVDSQIATQNGTPGTSFSSGAEKYWLLHPRLSETVAATGQPAAVNYGAWNANGAVQQTVGGRHDINYPGDMSQLFRAIQRYATRADGTRVDLLTWIEQNDGVQSEFTNLFRGAVS